MRRDGILSGLAVEMIRKPACIEYIEAMEQAADRALHQLAVKERMRLLKSRTAFIYADAWGESGPFENITRVQHVTAIDRIPKSLLKKFSIGDFTCKMRGEQHAFMQALSLAQDYLRWDIFDFVVICAAYRAIPLLVFSAAESVADTKHRRIKMNISVERVGCFIFSQRESALRVRCGSYRAAGATPWAAERLRADSEAVTHLAVAGLNPELHYPARAGKTPVLISLSERYGDSGCLSPALSWIYLERHAVAAAKMRTVMPGAQGSYHYFDTHYQP